MCSPTGTGTLAGLTELVLNRSDVPLAGYIGVVLGTGCWLLVSAGARPHRGLRASWCASPQGARAHLLATAAGVRPTFGIYSSIDRALGLDRTSLKALPSSLLPRQFASILSIII